MESSNLGNRNHLRDSHYSLENFYSATEAEKDKLLAAINKNVQFVVIATEVGMGGTHLLSGIYKQVAVESLSINYEYLIFMHENKRDIELNLSKYKYLFLDDWHAFYNRCEGYLSLVKFIESEIEQFVLFGGKVFIKINPFQTPKKLKTFIERFTSEEIHLKGIEKSILKRRLADMYQDLGIVLEKKLENELLKKEYSSYRGFENEFICLIAKSLKN